MTAKLDICDHCEGPMKPEEVDRTSCGKQIHRGDCLDQHIFGGVFDPPCIVCDPHADDDEEGDEE